MRTREEVFRCREQHVQRPSSLREDGMFWGSEVAWKMRGSIGGGEIGEVGLGISGGVMEELKRETRGKASLGAIMWFCREMETREPV